MKRYLVFSGLRFYPMGGANDSVAAFEDLAAATKEMNSRLQYGDDWSHVLDVEEVLFVASAKVEFP